MNPCRCVGLVHPKDAKLNLDSRGSIGLVNMNPGTNSFPCWRFYVLIRTEPGSHYKSFLVSHVIKPFCRSAQQTCAYGFRPTQYYLVASRIISTNHSSAWRTRKHGCSLLIRASGLSVGTYVLELVCKLCFGALCGHPLYHSELILGAQVYSNVESMGEMTKHNTYGIH